MGLEWQLIYKPQSSLFPNQIPKILTGEKQLSVKKKSSFNFENKSQGYAIVIFLVAKFMRLEYMGYICSVMMCECTIVCICTVSQEVGHVTNLIMAIEQITNCAWGHVCLSAYSTKDTAYHPPITVAGSSSNLIVTILLLHKKKIIPGAF